MVTHVELFFAIYLAGNAVFNFTVIAQVPWSRLIGLLTLGALAPVALLVAPVVLSALATLVILTLAAATGTPRRPRPK
jgi:hypothetical protein